MNVPVTFRNTTAIAARALEVTDADWDNGMNNSCNCPGVGVATDNSGLDESLPEWTLLDQFGDARVPQVSQLIGGNGFTPESDYPLSGGVSGNGSDQAQFLVGVANPDFPDNDGTVVVQGTANLADLAVGWALV